MTFNERLEHLLKSKKITQKELAISLGIRIPTISDWKKNGTIPPGDICLEIANLLNVSVEWLISGKEHKNQKVDDIISDLQNVIKKYAVKTDKQLLQGFNRLV